MAGIPGAAARLVAIVVGASAGALLRHGQGVVLPGHWGTLATNVLGSLALGVFLAAERASEPVDPLWRAFFAAGFCGAFTTFSTFASEVHGLMRHDVPGAVLYVAASLLLGVGAAWLGGRVSLKLPTRPSVLSGAILGAATLAAGAAALEGKAGAAVVLGGSLGALARAGLGALLAGRLGRAWGTVIINVTGSALIGGFEGAAPGASPLVRLLLVTGFLGGYTTFSTFAAETVVLAREASRARAALNVLVSVLGALAACALAHALSSARRP